MLLFDLFSDDDGLEQGSGGRQPIKQTINPKPLCFKFTITRFLWREEEGDETRQIENKEWSESETQSEKDGVFVLLLKQMRNDMVNAKALFSLFLNILIKIKCF